MKVKKANYIDNGIFIPGVLIKRAFHRPVFISEDWEYQVIYKKHRKKVIVWTGAPQLGKSYFSGSETDKEDWLDFHGRKYEWDNGHYLTDGPGPLLLLSMDISKLTREDTGERVVLIPPRRFSIHGFRTVYPIKCKVYYLPDAKIYIAIGEIHTNVFFVDMNTLTEEIKQQLPPPGYH